MSVQIRGTSANIADVDAAQQLKVNPPTDIALAGFTTLAAEADPGAITGERRTLPAEITDDYRLRTGVDGNLFDEQFIGAAINTALWFQAATTATITVGSGFLTLNGGSSVAANAVAQVRTYRAFPVYGSFPTYYQFRGAYLTNSPNFPTNTQVEWGCGYATGTAAPTDGAFFRVGQDGNFRAVVSYNGTEQQSAPITDADLTALNVEHLYVIARHGNSAQFWIDNVLVARLETASNSTVTSQNQLPVYMRAFNGAVAPTFFSALRVGQVSISLGDMAQSRSWEVVCTGQGGMGAQGQTGGTVTQTANYVNSTAPAAATLSNTAAGYTTLGGQFVFNAPAGAETDFALFAYQVPAYGVGLPGRTLYVKGIWIDAVNVGAAVGATPTILQWAIGVGSTAVSLATAEAAGGKAPRRVALGIQSFIAASPIGAPVERIDSYFDAPLVAQPGEFVHVIVRVPVGLATASQQIRGTVGISAFWE